jgi:hypothetical protein
MYDKVTKKENTSKNGVVGAEIKRTQPTTI